jgi:hypothetical protein
VLQGSVVRMLSSSGATRSAWFEGYASHLAPRATTPAGVGLGNVLRDCVRVSAVMACILCKMSWV